MKLSGKQFEDLLQNLPSIDIELYFEGDEKFYQAEQHEILLEDVCLYADFEVRETGTSDSGDHLTPPSFTSDGKKAFVSNVEILDNETDNVVVIDSEQFRMLCSNLELILEA